MSKRKKFRKPGSIVPVVAIPTPYDPLRFLIVFWATTALCVLIVACADHATYPRDLGPPPEVPASNSVAIPPQARQFLNQSLAAYQAGNWLDCVDKATAALVIVPAYPEALINRGAAEVQLHHFDLAIADEQTAIDLKPSPGSVKLATANKAWAIAEKAKLR